MSQNHFGVDAAFPPPPPPPVPGWPPHQPPGPPPARPARGRRWPVLVAAGAIAATIASVAAASITLSARDTGPSDAPVTSSPVTVTVAAPTPAAPAPLPTAEADRQTCQDGWVQAGNLIRSAQDALSVLPPDVALAYGCTGPVLRACGVPYDVRRAEPYSIYDEFDWDVAVGKNGDIYDRFDVRFEEMRQSLRILRQALERIPDGPVLSKKVQATAKVPAGEAYGRVESPKGELGFYVVSDGTANPYRYRIRTPSFANLGVLGEISRGHLVADVVAILASIDITLGEVDR